MPISLAKSSFTVSSLPVDYNAVKSLIFSAARLFFGLALYKCFSLIAARLDLFSSYLMFSEDYTQNALYMWSRGFSRNTLLVLSFAILYAVANLYGTLLWGLCKYANYTIGLKSVQGLIFLGISYTIRMCPQFP